MSGEFIITEEGMRAAARQIRIAIHSLEKGSGCSGADNPENAKWLDRVVERDVVTLLKHARATGATPNPTDRNVRQRENGERSEGRVERLWRNSGRSQL